MQTHELKKIEKYIILYYNNFRFKIVNIKSLTVFTVKNKPHLSFSLFGVYLKNNTGVIYCFQQIFSTLKTM